MVDCRQRRSVRFHGPRPLQCVCVLVLLVGIEQEAMLCRLRTMMATPSGLSIPKNKFRSTDGTASHHPVVTCGGRQRFAQKEARGARARESAFRGEFTCARPRVRAVASVPAARSNLEAIQGKIHAVRARMRREYRVDARARVRNRFV